jgi:hypothetical protein
VVCIEDYFYLGLPGDVNIYIFWFSLIALGLPTKQLGFAGIFCYRTLLEGGVFLGMSSTKRIPQICSNPLFLAENLWKTVENLWKTLGAPVEIMGNIWGKVG